MTEELNKNQNGISDGASLPSAAEPTAQEKLRALSGLIKETDRNAEIRKSERERSILEGEKNKEKRLNETRVIMEENAERARAAAKERTARLEYGAEYRKMLIERENKRAASEKARLDAEQKEADMLREAERRSEIEDFMRREREELEARTQKTKSILEKINSEVSLSDDGEHTDAYAEEQQTAAAVEAEAFEEKIDTPPSISDEKSESDRIILNINPNLKNQQKTEADGKNVIHIPARYYVCHTGENANLDLHYADGSHIDGATESERFELEDENHPELLYESAYREYYRGAAELYDRELLDEYEKYRKSKEGPELFDLTDEAALSEYEADVSRKLSSEYSHVETEDFNINDIGIGIDRSEKDSEDIDGFARAELSKRLGAYHKQESALRSDLRRIEAKQKNVSYAENVRLTVEKIGVRKEIVEIAIEALRACVYAGSKVNISKHKKFLEKEIYRYNGTVSEYETLTGKKLTRLSPKMADDVVEGRICQSIPKVYYLRDEHYQTDSITHYSSEAPTEPQADAYGYAARGDRGLQRSETESAGGGYGETREGEKEFSKELSKRINEIRRLSERDVLLVALRNEYKLSEYETEYHTLQHSFSVKRKQKAKRMQKLERRISNIKSNLKCSIKMERDDNRRYYYLLTIDPLKERVRSSARRDVLDALKLRLEVLLHEREEINERIIALYGGSDKNLKKLKIDRRATSVRKKFTKLMYRRQERLAIKAQRMKAPEDLKEKLFALLNKKTERVGALEEYTYKLRRGRLKGKARRELISEIKKAKASLKYIDKDIIYLMKKLKRHQERYEDDREWAITLIVFSLIAVGAVIGWYFFGDSIKSYLAGMWAALRGSLM